MADAITRVTPYLGSLAHSYLSVAVQHTVVYINLSAKFDSNMTIYVYSETIAWQMFKIKRFHILQLNVAKVSGLEVEIILNK